MALRLDAQGDELVRSANLPSPTSFTMCGWVRRRGAGGANQLVGAISDGGANAIALYAQVGATTEWHVSSTGGSTVSTGVAATQDAWFFAALSCAGTGATDAKVRVAAVGGASLTTAQTTGTSFTATALFFGVNHADYYPNVALAGWRVYDRVLTDAELLAEMTRLTPASTTNLNFWTPMVHDVVATSYKDFSGNGRDWSAVNTVTFEDGPPIGWGAPVLFVNAAASASVAITPGAGSLALTGYAPSANRTAHQSVTPGAGAVVLTGAAPSVSVTSASVLTPGSGALTLTGSAPSVALTAHKWLTPDSGAVVLAGSAPSADQTTHRWLTPDAGAVVLTGVAPEVTVTQSGVISPASGALTLTGYAPVQTLTIRAAPAVLVLTGYAPSVSVSNSVAITPDAGAVVLAGSAPGVTKTAHLWLVPDAGAVVLSGAAPSVSVSEHRTIAPDASSLTLTGYAPSLAFTNPVLVPANAEIVITGYAPNVIAIRPNKGAGKGGKGRRRVVIRERVYEVNERDIPALLEAELLDRAPPVTAEVVEGPKPPRKRGKKAPQPVKTVEQVREAVQQIKARIEPDNAWLAQALETVAFRVLERLQDEEDSLMLLLAA